ncbi:MAG: 2-dehydropantoate 2-reductase N-terminal domain-containing protein, partial [Gemmatimonadota bacterium]
MSSPICVLGAGSWGTALAHVLARNGHEVTAWSHSPSVAEDIAGNRRNTKYLPGIELAPFGATTEMSEALAGS